MAAPRLGQFRLLASRRFGPLCAASLLGTVVDVLVLTALGTLFLREHGMAASDVPPVMFVLIVVFAVPLMLVSAAAGDLGDRLEKARALRLGKLGEIGIATLAAFGLYAQYAPVLWAVLALLGVRCACLGPLRQALLAERLASDELAAGHALGHAATFAAAVAGGGAGSALGASPNAPGTLAMLVAAVAVAGYVVSRWIPPAPVRRQGPLRWRPWGATQAVLKLAREDRAVAQSMLGVAWFWLLALAYPMLLLAWAGKHGESAGIALAAVFALAVAAGALLCARLSRGRVELGLVPIGAVGVSAFGIDAAFAMAALPAAETVGALALLGAPGSTRLLIDLGCLGASAALFAVPLQANIQARSRGDRRARLAAGGQMLAAPFAYGGAALVFGWFTFGASAPALMLALAAVNLGVAAYIFRQVPEFAMRFLVWAISHSFYRVRHEGLAAIPEHGPAVLACNHVSYVDALLLAGAVRRPIRFVVYKPIYEIPVLRSVFRASGAIPIAAEHEDPAALEAAFAAIRRALAEGDLLCIFPEGRLTADGRLGVFRKGIERILAETPVPVVPMALRGLWGSFFSRHGKGAFRRLPGRFWSRVTIAAGAPVPPALATAELLRSRVAALAQPT